jgi:hypothetical protein
MYDGMMFKSFAPTSKERSCGRKEATNKVPILCEGCMRVGWADSLGEADQLVDDESG